MDVNNNPYKRSRNDDDVKRDESKGSKRSLSPTAPLPCPKRLASDKYAYDKYARERYAYDKYKK